MRRKHLPVDTGQPIYNLLAGVCLMAMIDARRNNKTGLEAQGFLDSFVPGWQALQLRGTITVEDVIASEVERSEATWGWRNHE